MVDSVSCKCQALTGAEVDIKIQSQSLPADGSFLGFWVGADLSNDAFIQVGYEYGLESGVSTPEWFWEYFLPGTASEGAGPFLGQIGSELELGSWAHFSLEGLGAGVWTTSVNGQVVGSANLGDGVQMNAYANLENGGASRMDNAIQPVEFRDLGFKDAMGWHLAPTAGALIGFGAGTGLQYQEVNPLLGLESVKGVNDDWFAGSNLPQPQLGDVLWPWYRVAIILPNSTSADYYLDDQEIGVSAPSFIQSNPLERLSLEGWAVNGKPFSIAGSITATDNMNITTVYVKQFFLNVTSGGPAQVIGANSGWYNSGSTVRFTVSSVRYDVLWAFQGWYANGRFITGSSTGSLILNEPTTIAGRWGLDYAILGGIVGIAALATVLPLLLYRFRRSRLSTSHGYGR
jgi:hypothetical protein